MIRNCTVLSLLAMLVAGCTSSVDKQPKENVRTLPVVQLQPRDTLLHTQYVANIEALKNVEIRSRITGFIEEILVDEGQEVHKGQPLFRLSNSEYQAQLDKALAVLKSAKAEAHSAQLEADRVEVLVNKKIISSSELALAESKVQSAQARVAEAQSAINNARTLLSYTFIRSPFDGVIDRIPLKTGSLVDEGTLMTSISDIHAVYAYFNVSESEYLRYFKHKDTDTSRQMDALQLVLADGSVYPHKGRIETIESEIDESTGSLAFRARFDNPTKILKHGGSGTIRLATEVGDALLVPQQAVMELQDKNFVFVVDNANKVKMRSFVPKTRVASFYLIKSGLQAGDRIVCEGVQDLREGMTIDPVMPGGAKSAAARL